METINLSGLQSVIVQTYRHHACAGVCRDEGLDAVVAFVANFRCESISFGQTCQRQNVSVDWREPELEGVPVFVGRTVNGQACEGSVRRYCLQVESTTSIIVALGLFGFIRQN